MSTAELKSYLVAAIEKENNKEILEEISRLLDSDVNETEIYELSEEQRKKVIEAQNEISKGKFLTNDQANKEIDEWLSK